MIYNFACELDYFLKYSPVKKTHKVVQNAASVISIVIYNASYSYIQKLHQY